MPYKQKKTIYLKVPMIFPEKNRLYSKNKIAQKIINCSNNFKVIIKRAGHNNHN